MYTGKNRAYCIPNTALTYEPMKTHNYLTLINKVISEICSNNGQNFN